MVDVEMLPQHGRVVLVVLQDGRQLEGELIMLTGHYAIGGVVFQAWEIEEFGDVDYAADDARWKPPTHPPDIATAKQLRGIT